MLVSVVPQELSAQVDHTILEVWIQNHKKTSNRLKERIATQGTAAATELMREDRTDEVKQKIDTLTQRNKLAMSDLTLLFDAAGIVTQVRETADITVDAIDLALALSVKHPDVLTTSSGTGSCRRLRHVSCGYVKTCTLSTSIAGTCNSWVTSIRLTA